MRPLLTLGLILSAWVLRAAAASADDAASDKGWTGHVFLTANGGYQAAANEFTSAHTEEDFFLKLTASSTVTGKSAAALDLGGGVRLVRNFGIGAVYSRVNVDETATLVLDVTSPFFPQSITGSLAGPARREERALHLDAIYMIPVARRLNVTLFAGPSRFKVKHALVKDAEVDMTGYPPDAAIHIQSLEMKDVEESAWGVNAAAGLDYMFSKNVGVGALVRYSHAQVKVQNFIEGAATGEENTAKSVDVDLGGLQVTGGVRIRF